MKIKVKHWTTEIEVSDNNGQEDGRGLIYNNQNYVITLLEKIFEIIHKLNETDKQEL
jgi:hypothetical protein